MTPRHRPAPEYLHRIVSQRTLRGMRLALALFLVLAGRIRGSARRCNAELDARHVACKKAKRPGIANGVEITGPLGGITRDRAETPLVIDCSLAVSLDEAGQLPPRARARPAHFSSAYSRRNVRGTNRPSKHSYGLAIDIRDVHRPRPRHAARSKATTSRGSAMTSTASACR